MQSIEFPSLADQVRTLPDGAARNRQLQRLVDLHASAEALGALRQEIAAARDAVLLTAAAEVLADRALDADPARDQLHRLVASPEFLALVPGFVREMREIASARPDTGACTLATALEIWSWTMKHFRSAGAPDAVIDELASAIAPLLAARALVRSVALHTTEQIELRQDLSRVYSARVAAATGTTCAELVFGHRRHLVWNAEGCAACIESEDLDDLEAIVPGAASGFSMTTDVIGADGRPPVKAGPCARFDGLDSFMRLRTRLDGCLTGARSAKDRAAATLANNSKSEGNA